MCSKMVQYQATASYRERSSIVIRDSAGVEGQASWLGHVRMESLGEITGLRPVEVPGITALEHHGKGFLLKGPVSIKGMVRDMNAGPGLFVLTQSLMTKTGLDRWPILTFPVEADPESQQSWWKGIIAECWKIDEKHHRSFQDFIQALGGTA